MNAVAERNWFPTKATEAARTVRRSYWRHLLLIGGWLLLLSLPGGGIAAELIVVEQPGCYACVRFNKELGPSYGLSTLGRDVPLRRVDINHRWPYRGSGVRRPMGTPTFILVDGGKEIGRFAGYGDGPRFWKKLEAVLAKR
jgi:hypothetical protein